MHPSLSSFVRNGEDGHSIDYFNHAPGGCNILYMDGHVEFARYPRQGSRHPEGRPTARIAAGLMRISP
ncbi:MAG TPA: hypothetical protein PLO37_11195 [Candidatus Hydrogenedentes bacterium]|nr:hypothetical protein [Candidatus Hydrogenedentota bacterium]HPG67404.1 hypothetical protein [Candidatus Hydrogenedentota bacterium]